MHDGQDSAPVRHRPAVQIALLATAQLCAMTLWFSATAVLPALQSEWGLGPSGSAWLTAAVQLGFVCGALVSAVTNLADLLPPRRLAATAATLGAVANLLLAWTVDSLAPALLLRFITGFCLAGVYPPGMKVAAGHVSGKSRGLAIGVLVGALTAGSAAPHLVAGLLSETISYRVVLSISSGLALLGACLVGGFVTDGPFASPPAPFDPRQAAAVFKNRPLLLANLGYCGHMWELYAAWTWLATFLMMSLGPAGEQDARIMAFVSIGAAGAVGCVGGGWAADRLGRTIVTSTAMAVSGACCLLSPAVFGAAAPVLLVFGVVWGASVIADSAQFSAAVTELADPAYVGTALTLQTCIGFALTMITIWGLPVVAEAVGWRFAFLVLAPGPALGCVAMLRLRARAEAVRMAGGRR